MSWPERVTCAANALSLVGVAAFMAGIVWWPGVFAAAGLDPYVTAGALFFTWILSLALLLSMIYSHGNVRATTLHFSDKDTNMPDVIIIGDGPAGLSAALFLAKNGKDVHVFGTDQTPMHKAMVLNYLGIPKITGSEFQRVARQQVQDMGATLHSVNITQTARHDETFTVTTDDGRTFEAKYLIFAAGVGAEMAEGVGLTLDERKMIDADRNGRTSVENAYVVGWSTRPDKIQAIISAGDGAAAALDILSKEAGKEIHDFDVV